MTNAEIQKLLDEAVVLLEQTTVGWAGHSAAWQANQSTKWWQGRNKIRQARAALDPAQPPPPPPPGVAAPVGPFTVIDGGGTRESGVFPRDRGGTTITKQHVKRYRGYGIANMDYMPPAKPTGRFKLSDCIVEDIASSPPKSMNGTGEAGFWFGNPTDAARLIARRCAWMGMWTGAQCVATPEKPSVIEDFQLLEMPHVGLYVEHVTAHAVFRRFKIHSQGTGINVEWWYGGNGSHHLVFEDGDIYCPPKSHWTASGIFLDAGTYGCTVRRCRFHGPGDAIGLPNRLAQNVPNVVDEASCRFENAGKRVWYHENGIG